MRVAQQLTKVLERLHNGKQPLKNTPKWVLKGLESAKSIEFDYDRKQWLIYTRPLSIRKQLATYQTR